jgi:hypothetical protein
LFILNCVDTETNKINEKTFFVLEMMIYLLKEACQNERNRMASSTLNLALFCVATFGTSSLDAAATQAACSTRDPLFGDTPFRAFSHRGINIVLFT